MHQEGAHGLGGHGEHVQGTWHLRGKGCLMAMGTLCLGPSGFVPVGGEGGGQKGHR